MRPTPVPASNPATLAEAVDAMAEKLARAKTAAILAGYLITRLGCSAAALDLVEATGLPFATMLMDKTALDETHPQYIGMYDGRLMNPEIREFIEGCDCVLNLGALWSDLNTGAYTANLNPSKVIEIRHHYVRVGHAIFPHIDMPDALEALAGKVSRKRVPAPQVHGLGRARRLPRRPDHPGLSLPALGEVLQARRPRRRRDRHRLLWPRFRPDAGGLDVSQPDALGFHGLGHPRGLRRGAGRAPAAHPPDHR